MGFRANKPWNSHCSTSFLRYWRERAKVGYVELEAKAKRTKGDDFQMALCQDLIKLIDQELHRRGENE